MLLKKGASPNICDNFKNNAMKKHLQLFEINEDIVNLLLFNGFDPSELSKREKNKI